MTRQDPTEVEVSRRATYKGKTAADRIIRLIRAVGGGSTSYRVIRAGAFRPVRVLHRVADESGIFPRRRRVRVDEDMPAATTAYVCRKERVMSDKRRSGIEKFWNDLQQLEPADVCGRAQVEFIDGRYVIPFIDREYQVDPSAKTVARTGDQDEPGSAVGNHFTMLFLAYLVGADPQPPSGTWVTVAQLPGGDLFFNGPHGLPVGPLLAAYGESAQAFIDRCKALGAEVLEFGDASVSLRALPKMPVAFVLWAGDEEFPAELKVMFDSTVDRHVPLDILLSLVRAVSEVILDT